MRPLLAILVLMVSVTDALAGSSDFSKRSRTATCEPPPSKRAVSRNPCAAYGAGFARMGDSDTCVSIGGVIGIGGGVSSGSR
jgi:hypothetical protein